MANSEIYPDPGTMNESYCGVCGKKMLVERDQDGPTSYAMALGGMKRRYDHFFCPDIKEEWHKYVSDLRSEQEKTRSPSLKAIFEKDIEAILEIHRREI